MARLPNRKGQALKFFTNGKRADDRYALFEQVGRIVKQTDVAARRAQASTARRAVSFSRAEVLQNFNVRSAQLSGRYRVVQTGSSIRLFASERRISLIAFGGRWAGKNSPGATAEIERGSRVTYTGSFVRTIQGNRAIRVRASRGAKRVHRGPVTMLYGPSPRDMITGARTDPETRNPTGRYAGDVGDKIIRRLVVFHVSELRRLYALADARG